MVRENGIYGIDVSTYRGYVNWHEVIEDQQQIKFAITKATDGDEYIDSTFDMNWTGMRRVGLIRGAFHYLRPKIDPIAQADHFLAVMQGINHSFDLPLILDVERGKKDLDGVNRTHIAWKAMSLEDRKDQVGRFLKRLRDVTGRIPILYTNHATWDELFDHCEDFVDYPLWLARYSDEEPEVPASNWGGAGYTIWQFTEDGIVEGVNKGKPPVDINWYPGSLADLRNDFGLNETPMQHAEYLNTDVIEAFKATASESSIDVDELLSAANLSHIKITPLNIERPYAGPAIEELPGINTAIRKNLKKFLKDIDRSPTNIGKPGLSNQDVIRLFQAADSSNKNRWLKWIRDANLTSIYEERFVPYCGPTIDEMENLDDALKDSLKSCLGISTIQPESDEVEPTYPDLELTNGDMVTIFFRVASELETNVWSLFQRTRLVHIFSLDETLQLSYTGPKIDDLPNLTGTEKSTFNNALDEGTPHVSISATEASYPGLINQDIVNVIIRVANQHGENPWNWLKETGLSYLLKPESNRRLPYTGPLMEELPKLAPNQKQKLKTEIERITL